MNGAVPDTIAAIVLPQRERYERAAAGAIALQVSRLAGPQDWVLGTKVDGEALPGGRFVPVTLRGFGLTPAARYAHAVARTLRRLPRPPACIEVHNRPEIALHLARLLGRQFPARLALFLHNDPQSMRRADTPRARAALLRRMAVVCVSDWLRGRFVEGLAADAPVAVLHNGLDPAALPASLPVDARDPVLLFVGRTVADKGADVFVEACARALPELPGWRAAMLGADGFGAGAKQTPFMAWLREAAPRAGVELLGYRPHAATLAEIARAAVVAVPSRWPEPFGLTALEALACGAPLVASATGGMAEIVGGGEADGALLVAPGDAAALAAALLRLARDPDLRARLQVAGLARAQHFHIRRHRAALVRLRDSLYGSARSWSVGTY